jgi:putative transposase
MAFKKALIERALGAELSHHLGYPPGATKPEDATNHRNGASGKTVLTEDGPLRVEVPRDRDGSFEPLLIPKMSGASPASTTRSSPCTHAA